MIMLKPVKMILLSVSVAGTLLSGLSLPAAHAEQNPYPPLTKAYCDWKKHHDLEFARTHYKTPETYNRAVIYINNSYNACMTKAEINAKKPVKDNSVYAPPPGGNTTRKTGKGVRQATPLRRNRV